MDKYRIYTRELPKSKPEYLKIKYSAHIHSKGFLSPNQKKRLLGLKKMERGTTDSDFWYRIKRSAKNALLDLQLISEIASDSQLMEIFSSLTVDEYREIDKNKGKYTRTDPKNLFNAVLSSDGNALTDNNWKYGLAHDLVNVGLDYVTTKKKLYTELHRRIFQDVRDILIMSYDYGRDKTLIM